MTEAPDDLRAIVAQGPHAVEAYLAATPLAAADAKRERLLAIRRDLPGAPGFTLSVASAYSATHLPMPDEGRNPYRGLVVSGTYPNTGVDVLTEAWTIRTSVAELGSKLAALGPDPSPDAVEAVWDDLTGERPAPVAVEPERAPFPSRVLGAVPPDDWDEAWTTDPVPVPLARTALPVTILAEHPAADVGLDDALTAFLALDDPARAEAAPRMLAYCHHFLSLVGADEPEDTAMAAITDAGLIWRHVRPTGVTAQRGSGSEADTVFVTLSCDCDWEGEHALQLVYADGTRLVRVSPQDGHPTGRSY